MSTPDEKSDFAARVELLSHLPKLGSAAFKVASARKNDREHLYLEMEDAARVFAALPEEQRDLAFDMVRKSLLVRATRPFLNKSAGEDREDHMLVAGTTAAWAKSLGQESHAEKLQPFQKVTRKEQLAALDEIQGELQRSNRSLTERSMDQMVRGGGFVA